MSGNFMVSYPDFDDQLRHIAGSVGHDLKNVITAVYGSISLAREELESPRLVESRLDQIALWSRRATVLAHQLLVLDGGSRFASNRELKDLSAELIRDRVTFEMSITEAAVITFELAPNLPKVRISDDELTGLALSLITNAAEALPQGSGIIRVQTSSEGGASGEEFVCLDIEDDGSGIPPELLPRVREPFVTTKQHKRGLGLYYVSRVVDSLEGVLELRSSEKGTRVRVRLPSASS